MTREDLDAVVNQVPGIIASSPMLEDHEQVSIGGGRTKDVMLLGVSPQYKEIRNLKPLAGRFFDDEDAQQHAKVAVIAGPCCDGALASQLFGSPRDSIGQTLTVKGIPFTVVGVYVESTFDAGQSEIGDGGVLIPYEVARYFTGTDKVKEIFFQMGNSNIVEPAAQQISALIQSRHRATSVYKAQTLTDVLSIMNNIANMLTVVLILAAFITLIVSGVGIMNSMLANVGARIKEIGIRKALGATRREIRMQFLTESVFLSLSGGLVGTIIGLALPLGLRMFSSVKIPVSPWSAVIALATSVLVGVGFGTLPAQRAARLDPVATLKYE
jgi:putative ABC transport system permease protein